MGAKLNCRQANELLPWLLNETLEPDERRAVKGHLEDCDACRESLEETRAALATYAQHLPAAVLIDVVDGREPEMDRELVEAHLASCETCAEELALVRESREAVEAEEPAHGSEHGKVLPMRPARKPVLSARGWQWAAMAAALAGLVAGGAEIARLRGRIADLSSAEINVAVVDLFPDELVLRGQDPGEPAVRISAATGRVTLILNSRLTAAGELGIEVFDAGGRVISDRGGLRRGEDGLFAVSLPTESLPAGALTLNIYETADGRRVPLESYSFQIR